MATLDIEFKARGLGKFMSEVNGLSDALSKISKTNLDIKMPKNTSFKRESDSILGLRSRLNELTKEYNSLSESQRNSSRVQNTLVPQIQRLNNIVSQQRGNILAANGSYAQAQQRLSALGAA